MRSKVILFAMLLFVSLSFAQDKAPGFTLKNADGEEVSLSAYEGKIVMLEWFTTWCSKCRAALPEVKPFLNKINKEYA